MPPRPPTTPRLPSRRRRPSTAGTARVLPREHQKRAFLSPADQGR
jgi:hypothetical protein